MNRIYEIALYFAALVVPVAHAAELTDHKPVSAANADARVPAPKYDSAFTGYQPYRSQALARWHEVNDEVHKAGGHIGIVGGASGAPAAQHPPEPKK